MSSMWPPQSTCKIVKSILDCLMFTQLIDLLYIAKQKGASLNLFNHWILRNSISVPSAQFQKPFCSTFSDPNAKVREKCFSLFDPTKPNSSLSQPHLQIHCQRTAAWGFKDIGRDLKGFASWLNLLCILVTQLILANPILLFQNHVFRTLRAMIGSQHTFFEGLKGWPVGSYQ